MTDREQFITHDFKLPVHSNELSKAEEIIEKLKHRLEVLQMQRTIDDKSHDLLYNEIVRILDYVGRLSMPAFAIEEEIEQMYVLQFKHAPQLGKHLWLLHYEDIHHPYTLLKNRCFRLLEDLDQTYFKKFNTQPPNWKI
jgi:hypothetical protein